MTYDTTKHALIRNTPLIDNYVTHTLARYIYFFSLNVNLFPNHIQDSLKSTHNLYFSTSVLLSQLAH